MPLLRLLQSGKEDGALVELLVTVLKQNKLNKDTFLYCFIKQQLQCLDWGDARAFRWDPAIVDWAGTLLFHGGARLLDDIRGRATEGKCYKLLHIISN